MTATHKKPQIERELKFAGVDPASDVMRRAMGRLEVGLFGAGMGKT